jgi:hypothetical protein
MACLSVALYPSTLYILRGPSPAVDPKRRKGNSIRSITFFMVRNTSPLRMVKFLLGVESPVRSARMPFADAVQLPVAALESQ